jgi:hypothetical protein
MDVQSRFLLRNMNMRTFEMEWPSELSANDSWIRRAPGVRHGGLCRIGEALSELLAIYPVEIEAEPEVSCPEVELDIACWELAYSASRT